MSDEMPEKGKTRPDDQNPRRPTGPNQPANWGGIMFGSSWMKWIRRMAFAPCATKACVKTLMVWIGDDEFWNEIRSRRREGPQQSESFSGFAQA